MVSGGTRVANPRDASLRSTRNQAGGKTIARGAANANTRYVITARPSREGGHESVDVEVKMSGNTGENVHAASAYPLRAAPTRWSVGGLLGCHTGAQYAVVTVIVKAGEHVIASAHGRRVRLRVAQVPFALGHGRSQFLYGGMPWAPTEITLRNAVGREIAFKAWSRAACDGATTTISELQ